MARTNQTGNGGGNSLLIPMTEFSLGLTGDIDAITNAHNLCMVAMTARMQHERNYNDEQLQRLTGMRRLDIDPTRVELGWIIDYCAQALRNIIIGIGGRFDGFTMQSKFGIAVGSELMAMLSIVTDLADLRKRMDEITLAYDKKGNPVTTEDLEVAGAMTAWLREAVNPNLLQSLEGQPCFVHAGPFANIAVGQSSVVADKLCLKLGDYHLTESGFGADIGFEKFWNVKSRFSGLKPHVSVLTTTIRALKMHGGGPAVVTGKALPDEYTKENLEWVEKGCANMVHHINTIRKAGINPVVCINRFYTDTDAECAVIRKAAEAAGARCAESKHWEKGGDGALEFADAVIDACDEENDFKFLYPLETKLRDRVELIAKEVYGADGVSWSPEAEAKALPPGVDLKRKYLELANPISPEKAVMRQDLLASALDVIEKNFRVSDRLAKKAVVKNGKGCLILVNKWDLVADDKKRQQQLMDEIRTLRVYRDVVRGRDSALSSLMDAQPLPAP